MQAQLAVLLAFLFSESCVFVENLLPTALFVLTFVFSLPTIMVAELVEAPLSPLEKFFDLTCVD